MSENCGGPGETVLIRIGVEFEGIHSIAGVFGRDARDRFFGAEVGGLEGEIGLGLQAMECVGREGNQGDLTCVDTAALLTFATIVVTANIGPRIVGI